MRRPAPADADVERIHAQLLPVLNRPRDLVRGPHELPHLVRPQRRPERRPRAQRVCVVRGTRVGRAHCHQVRAQRPRQLLVRLPHHLLGEVRVRVAEELPLCPHLVVRRHADGLRLAARPPVVRDQVRVLGDPAQRHAQHPDPLLPREHGRLRALHRHPQRRMRLLHRLRQHVPRWHREVPPLDRELVARPHLHDRARRLLPHLLCVVRLHQEPAQLRPRRAPPRPQLHATVAQDVERRDPLRHPRRVVDIRQHQVDPVPKPDLLRPRRAVGEEHVRRRHVRVLLEEVVFHRPGAVEPQLVRQLHHLDRLVEDTRFAHCVPRFRYDAAHRDSELHARPPPASAGPPHLATSATCRSGPLA